MSQVYETLEEGSKKLNLLAFEEKTLNLSKLVLSFFEGYVLFSGGRDSLVALHVLNRAAEELGVSITALHVDTTASIPDNLDYVKTVCKYLGVKLEVLRPRKDYFALVQRWGFPTMTRRWCCFHLKIEPLKNFLLSKSGPVMVFDGIRTDESYRRACFPQIGFHKHFGCLCCHIIFHWSSDNVREYTMKYNLYVNPLYDLGFKRASECWCPVYKTREQFVALKKNYPAFFSKLVELEGKLKTGGSMMFREGKKVYLKNV